MPQGSVLGPLLYLLYTSPLADVVKRHNVSYHFYSDDSQLYLSFKGNQQLAQSRQSLEQCLTDISSWMLTNGLKLNHDKTELMCIHSRFLSRPPLDEIVVCGETIVPCISAVYLVDRLQHVQNSAARVVTFTRKFDHITPVLIDLHWLPVSYRVIFKLLLLTYKALNGLAPCYLSGLSCSNDG